MRNKYATVIKARECPACSAINHVQFEFATMLVEGPCSSCGAMVQWRRRTTGSGGQIRTAFEDDRSTLIIADRGAADQ